MRLCVFFLIIGTAICVEDDFKLDQKFLDGYNTFTGNVYNELRKTNTGNFLVCPLSVDILLALVEYGSQGETSQQLIKDLNLPQNKEKIRDSFSTLTRKLNVNDKYTLTSANKVYVKEGHPILESFKKLTIDVYNAEIENIDFSKTESAAEKINKWVEEKTHSKIKNLIDKSFLDDYTRLVLVNALYFHGNWVTKFNSNHTKKEEFFLNKNSKTEVDLMEIKHDFYYRENTLLNAKFLELPYNGKDVTMTIVLPNEKDGLTSLEGNIKQVIAASTYTKERVHVKLPKFKIETKINFNDILKNLGIVRAFEDSAELEKITGEKLKISQVVQKAVIEVEESGTTAAAATAVYVSYVRSGHVQRETKEFIANHPFIFFLKYKSVVLFIGQFNGK